MSHSHKKHLAELGKSAEDILNVRLEIASHQSRMADLIDGIGRVLAHPIFFVGLFASHVLWVGVNLPTVPWAPWDPYPFTFLATVASVEAPFIALLILVYQRRDRRIAELREEIDLQVTLHVERKTAMALRMLEELEKKVGIETDHDALDRLKKDLDPEHLMQDIRERLKEAEGDEGTAP